MLIKHVVGFVAVMLAINSHVAQSAQLAVSTQDSQLSTEQSRKDDERSLSRLYSQCVNAAGGSDINMQGCTNEERNRWDQRLNKAYSAILNRNRDKTGMRNQERAWIKERDAKCINNDPERGTLDALNEASCMLIETVDRTLVLESVLRVRGLGEGTGENHPQDEAAAQLDGVRKGSP